MKTKRVGPRAASGEVMFETNASMADKCAENLRLDGLIAGDMCAVVEIDRQKRLLHTGSDHGNPDLKREIVA